MRRASGKRSCRGDWLAGGGWMTGARVPSRGGRVVRTGWRSGAGEGDGLQKSKMEKRRSGTAGQSATLPKFIDQGPQLQAAKLEATTPDQRRQTRQVQSTIPNAIVPWPSLRPVSASFAQVVVGNALDQSICHVGSRRFSGINLIVDGFEDITTARLEGAQTKDISKSTNNQCQHIYYQNQKPTDIPPLNPHCLGVPSRWTLH